MKKLNNRSKSWTRKRSSVASARRTVYRDSVSWMTRTFLRTRYGREKGFYCCNNALIHRGSFNVLIFPPKSTRHRISTEYRFPPVLRELGILLKFSKALDVRSREILEHFFNSVPTSKTEKLHVLPQIGFSPCILKFEFPS